LFGDRAEFADTRGVRYEIFLVQRRFAVFRDVYMYKVVLVPAACGEKTLDVALIEKNANEMAQQGYDVVQAYQTSSVGCTGGKSACVMIFKQRA